MVHSSVGYCPCGHEIVVEYLMSNGRWSCRFSDQEHPELSRCPACSREIKEEELEGV
jgi:hypothetical protein